MRRYKKEVAAAARRGQPRHRRARGHRRHRRRHRASWPSSPAPRSACRATPRSTSSAPRPSPASSPPTSTPARSRRWSPGWRCPPPSAAASPPSSARCGSPRRSTPSRSWASRQPAVPGDHPDDRRLRRGHPAVRRSACSSSYFATRLIATGYYGQSTGTYDHYFHLFLPPVDVLWSFVKVLVFAVVIILIHCYYGYNASGGPAGVGVAVGTAVRTSIVAINVIDFFLSPGHLGRDDHRPDRGVSAWPTQRVTPAVRRVGGCSAGVVFLAGHRAAGRADGRRLYQKAFTDGRHGDAARPTASATSCSSRPT